MTSRTKRFFDTYKMYKMFCGAYFALFIITFCLFASDLAANKINQSKISEKICVDGRTYVRDGETAIALLSPDGKPVLCWTK